MAKKLNYDEKSLLNVKFSPAQKGYNADEVDLIFDNIIKDYETNTSQINELLEQNANQLAKIKELKEELDRMTFELASIKKQYNLLKKTSNVTEDNYDLVLKVAAYERALHRKGVNLKKALSDPDNC